MNTPTTSNTNSIIEHNSKITLPDFCKQTMGSKIDNLVEYRYVPEEARIDQSIPPLMSPYNLYRRHKSGNKWLSAAKKLISTPRLHVKEQIQTNKFDQCGLRATSQEQYVNLLISKDLIKGREKGTCIMTLNNGQAVFMIFPNFNVLLTDPTLPSRFKVQVQILGAEQDEEAFAASLCHQIIWRVQDHCFDLPSNKEFKENALMVIATDGNEAPSIIQIPKQIPRKELEKLVPTEWITNYENFKAHQRQLVSTEADYRRNSVDDPANCDEGCSCDEHGYTDDEDDLFSDDDDDGTRRWREKPKPCKPPPPPKRRSDSEDKPWVGIRKKREPLPLYKEGLKHMGRQRHSPPPDDGDLITWPPPKNCPNSYRRKTKVQTVPTVPCMMNEEDFPPLERRDHKARKVVTRPYVQPTEVTPDGSSKPTSQAEEVLNWQTENALAQNIVLQRIEKKVDSFEGQLTGFSGKMLKAYEDLKGRVNLLEAEIESSKKVSFHEQVAKNNELQKLRQKIEEFEVHFKRPHMFPGETLSPYEIPPRKIGPTMMFNKTQQQPPSLLPMVMPHKSTLFGERSIADKRKVNTTHLGGGGWT
ncbi:hypothetical protein VNO77_03531 [Canavalia gladiata]|uniref:Uncharacterized protein n=1 Tax=Canavalia gladiata TaxID=3824 RepID=A0AAN9MUV0_CANGL